VITRHFIDVRGRRVHYRRAGSGPPVLMVHQSPRSSAEYEPLMRRWAEHFTCIAPDTPGFGLSDPLPGTPEIEDFADAIMAFVDAVGLGRVAAYGFHSGGIILVTALKRHPERFTGLAVGGYGVWTPAERAAFSETYLPPFRPSAYGEHLVWLWNRILEQSWFFPWYDVRPETRLPLASADPVAIDLAIRDMLDSGDAYRAGYGAVFRAGRDIPR
jgi:pimeloyl-ACP methyl ester carboxylesterase